MCGIVIILIFFGTLPIKIRHSTGRADQEIICRRECLKKGFYLSCFFLVYNLAI